MFALGTLAGTIVSLLTVDCRQPSFLEKGDLVDFISPVSSSFCFQIIINSAKIASISEECLLCLLSYSTADSIAIDEL